MKSIGTFFISPILVSLLFCNIHIVIAADTSMQIEEIVVTARKREENLQDTPIAITAFSSSLISERNLSNINEIDRYVPNLQASPAASGLASSSSLNIRGIGQTDFITTTDPGVAMYLDGVYLSRVTGSALDLANVERIEILRGPQGTLFGRNTIGGAVSIVTQKPGNEFKGKLDLTAGAFTDDMQPKVKGHLSVDVPIAENLAAQINILGKISDGWGKNNAPGRGEDLGADGDIAGRIALLYQASDDLEMFFTFDKSRRRGSAMPHGQVAGTPLAIPKDDPSIVAFSAPSDDDLDVWGTSFTIDWSFENFNFRSITAYREQDGKSGQDFDGSTFNFLDQSIDLEQEQVSQEFQLFGTALNGKLDWLLGFYYFNEDASFLSDIVLAGTLVDINTLNGTDSYAGFGHFTYRLTDALSVTAGIRYTTETKDLDVTTYFGPFTLVPRTQLDETFSAVSPKAGIEYKPFDNVFMYASYTKGFRSGGFNGRPFAPADLTPFDEEINTSYEVGVKTDLFDRKLRLNLSAYVTDYEDIQLVAVTTSAGGGFIVITDNAGEATLKGIEFEGQYLVNENLNIFAALGLNDNNKIVAKQGFTVTGGDTLPNASEVNSVLGFDYIMHMGNFETKIGADWSYRSEYYHQINNSEIVEENGYHLFNARVTITPNNGNWSLSLFGKNLSDEVYRVYGQTDTTFVVSPVWFGPTREFGATLSYNF